MAGCGVMRGDGGRGLELLSVIKGAFVGAQTLFPASSSLFPGQCLV